MSTNSTPGIKAQSTRPSRRASREQSTGLGSMISRPDEAPETPPSAPAAAPTPAPAAPTPAPARTTPATTEPAVTTSRLAAASAKRSPKVSFSTYVDADTNKRVDWLIRHRGFKKTDITADALDKLLDEMQVPPASDISD